MAKTHPNVRSRSWFIMMYDDPSASLTSLFGQCLNYVYIYHDKDDNEPHYHVLIALKNAKTFSALRSYCSGLQNFFAEPVRDKFACFRYLTHKDDPDKFQYDDSCLISNDIKYWQNLSDAPVASDGELALSMLHDIIDRKPFSYMVLTYGRDYLKNKRTYEECASCLRFELYGIPDGLPLVDVIDGDDVF